MTNTQIKQWLLAVGAQFGITEVHHIWRSDDKLRKPKDYFTFELLSSEPQDRHTINKDATALGSSNIVYTIAKGWKTTYAISCHSSRGQYILQYLEASRFVPGFMISIFGDSIKDFGCGQITTEPWNDESSKEPIYRMEINFHEWIEATFTESDMKVSQVDLVGWAEDDLGNHIVLHIVEPNEPIGD
jgi:hypothetical protein